MVLGLKRENLKEEGIATEPYPTVFQGMLSCYGFRFQIVSRCPVGCTSPPRYCKAMIHHSLACLTVQLAVDGGPGALRLPLT